MKLFKDLKVKINNLFNRKKNRGIIAVNYAMTYNKPQLIGKIDQFGHHRYKLTELLRTESKFRIKGRGEKKTKFIYRIQLI